MTFRGFADVWTPVLLARRLGRKPLRVVVAGEPVVLFRDGRGGLGALLDRCPHRGVALSLGRVTSEGELECAFHGWRFDAAGANRGAPLNPTARCAALGASALPVRQVGDLIWLYTRPGLEGVPELAPPAELTDAVLARTYVERQWSCHWTRAMENMLDSPHLPFVHRRSIGRPLRRRMRPESQMEVHWEDTEFGGRSWAELDGHKGGGLLEFHRPNLMVLHIPIPGKRLSIHAIIVPAAEGTTRLIIGMARDFARSPVFQPIFAHMNGKIADEDRAVVESSGPSEIPMAGQEHSVATDRATLQFRRYYHAVLKVTSGEKVVPLA